MFSNFPAVSFQSAIQGSKIYKVDYKYDHVRNISIKSDIKIFIVQPSLATELILKIFFDMIGQMTMAGL